MTLSRFARLSARLANPASLALQLRSSAYALSSSPAAAAVPALAAAARTSPLREVRALAVFCLGQSVSDDVLCVAFCVQGVCDGIMNGPLVALMDDSCPAGVLYTARTIKWCFIYCAHH